MSATLEGVDRARAVERLTALWALNEAGLGGLIHALRIPFTALVVGSTAVVLIALIAYFSERSARALVKATIVVLLVKGAASPHTPLPAYGAVALQGFAGAALFSRLPLRVAAMALGLLALLQGAVQKLITMTIIYGRTLWEALDSFGRWLLDKMGGPTEQLSPTVWFLTLYLGYYVLAGLVTGWLAGAIPSEIARALQQPRPRPAAGGVEAAELPSLARGRKRWWRRAPFKAGVVLLLLLLSSMWLQPGAGNWQRGLKVALRVLIVLGLWMGVVRPYGMKLLRRFRRREQAVYEADVARALAEFPALRRAAGQAWRQSGTAGLRRWKVFLVELILLALTGPAAGGGELSAAVAEEGGGHG